jgi:EAL domain-containing protein (putative c-di-GMP-specific phosphodiesterase class I)
MTQVESAHQTGGEEPARRHARCTRAIPFCYLIDREPGIRRMVASLMVSCGVVTRVFDTLADMPAPAPGDEPDLVLVDVTANTSDALTLIDQLAAAPIACAVQLLSGLNPVLVEQIRRHGAQSGLQMLPVLQKPLQSGALRRIVTDLGLRRDPHAAIAVDLEEILANDWLETWYQPTIDLKQRKLVGAEAFARARHPEHGVLTPDLFLPQAGERALVEMTRRVLGRALQDWPAFEKIGVPIELSINVPLVALSKLSIFAIMWEKKPETSQWPGLTLEISEEEAVGNLALLGKATAELRAYGIGLAIDSFGPRYAEFLRQPDLPFTTVKIDRSYIACCDTDRVNKGLSQTIIEFSDKFHLTSVAEGIETPGELNTLRAIGCDAGQGYLFARPQPRNDLIKLFELRTRKRTAA